MARGIGGDDGPSLWMFLACILIWGKIQGWFTSAKQSVNDVLDTNYSNPVQNETTADIKLMKDAAARIAVSWSKLGNNARTKFKALAMKHRQTMDTGGNMDEAALFAQVEHLSADQLRALAHCFGVQDRTNGVMSIWTGDIFYWYEKGLDDVQWYPSYQTELARMRKIWAKTGLWG